MAVKKKKSVKKSKTKSVPVAKGSGSEELERYFTPDDLAKYELAQYKLANSVQGAKIKRGEMAEYRTQAEAHLGRLELELQQIGVLVVKQQKELTELQKLLEAEYQVDLSKITYDDETGRILIPPDALEE